MITPISLRQLVLSGDARGIPLHDYRYPLYAVRKGAIDVRHRIFRRAAADEEGAVLVIITLSLIALFGMMVLVVDVGSLLFTRRALVNAADAAALAAAQSCGQKEGIGAANAQANQYTVANQSGASVAFGFPHYFPSCDSPAGLVTVRVTTERPLFFAPVLGFDSDAAVVTEATASWGGAGVGEHIAPLMLSANRLSDCQIPPEDPDSTEELTCTFWWNDTPPGQVEEGETALANAEWGTLSLDLWDVPANDNCTGGDRPVPPNFRDWMLDGYFEPLPINTPNPPGHTYVCRGHGDAAVLRRIINEVIAIDPPQFLYFPVNQPASQVDNDGSVCSPEMLAAGDNCGVHKYDIIGFARLQILEIWRGNNSWTHCPNIPQSERDPNAWCMVTKWKGYTSEGLNPQGGENFGLVPVRLVK